MNLRKLKLWRKYFEFCFCTQVNSLSTLLSPGDSSAVLKFGSGSSSPSPGSLGELADQASPGKGPGLATAPSLSRALCDNAGLETVSDAASALFSMLGIK